MKKQEKNGKRSASVFGRFCSAIALCTIIVTLAAAALPIIALSVSSISDRPAAGAADESSNIYSAERDGAVFETVNRLLLDLDYSQNVGINILETFFYFLPKVYTLSLKAHIFY